MIIDSPVISGSAAASFRNVAITGSLGVTGSITTTGTITAQTLIVQTITSSTDYVTGSTRFGSLSSNTHQFTGSMLITGSFRFGAATQQTAGSETIYVGQNSAVGPSDANSLSLSVAHAAATGSPQIAFTYQFRQNDNSGANLYGDAVRVVKNANTNSTYTVFTTNNTIGAGVERMRITSSGSVGINTSSPSNQLHIVGIDGSYFTDGIRVARNGTPSQYATLNMSGGTYNFAATNTTSGVPVFYWLISQDGTNYTSSMVLNDGKLGINTTSPAYSLDVYAASGYTARFNGATYGGLILASGSTANTYFVGESTLLSIEHTTAINLRTNNADRVRITSAGNVGIGSTSPARKFVVQNTAADPFISIMGAYPNQGGILFGDTTYTDSSCAIRIDRTNNALWFSTGGASSERMRITAGGNVAIGTSTIPSDTVGLMIGGTNSSLWRAYGNYSGGATGMDLSNSSNTTTVQFFGSSGNYYFAGSNISDRRSKTNIQAINSALSNLLQLKPSTFAYNLHPEIIKGGFIAQEVQEILPDFVTVPEDETEMMGVDYNGILAMAVKAIQELKAQNDSLQSQIDELKNK